jgi:hypothetical protein
MGKNAKLALVGIAGMSQVKMQGASKARILSPLVCEEPLNARIPGFVGIYESGVHNLLKEPAGVKHKLSRFVDAGFQGLRKVRAW